MKTKILFPLLIVSLVLASCIKDKSNKILRLYSTSYTVKQSVKDAAKLQEPEALQNLGSFVLYNNTMYINEKNKGIHVVDYSNPSNPTNKGFIPVPGSQGLSIKNDVLYADCYSDLFVFKIFSNSNIQLQNSVGNVFRNRLNSMAWDTNSVEARYIGRDTIVSADYYNNYINSWHYNADMAMANSNPQPQSTTSKVDPGNNNPSGGTSLGSSMAVFTIVDDYLYTVDNSNLSAFSLSDALHPQLASCRAVGSDMETIFPFKDRLFIGSMSGMSVYSLQDPSTPSYISRFSHARVCDPVIADDNFAFITLRSGSQCGGFTNQLDILNIDDITNPTLVRSFSLSNPHGLSKDGNVLFICDGNSGLKVLDVSDVNNIQLKKTFSVGNAMDVVALDRKAFVMLDDAIRIYAYDEQFNVELLGSLSKN